MRKDGDPYVLQPGPEFKVLGKNSLGEVTLATPAVSEDSLIIRTAWKLPNLGTRVPAIASRRAAPLKWEWDRPAYLDWKVHVVVGPK
jgi:hypothetical protein